MTKVKILVCGDVMGNFRTLFSKIEDLNKTRGPFESLYCVGNFFGSNDDEYEDLKSGKIEVPLVTYILNGNQTSFKELYEPLEKAVPKILYLGKMGCLTGTSGLKVAYLSGVELPDNLSDKKNAVADSLNKYNIYISGQLVKSMINCIGSGVDILLTSQWPKDVTNYAVSLDKDAQSKVNDASSYYVSYLAKHLKPRYHICGLSGLYYERVPYRNHIDLLEKPVHVTRFIGLAPVKKGKVSQKERWIYAFSIIPQSSLSSQQLLQNSGPATVCPYGDLMKGDDVDRNFFFDASVNKAGPSTSKKRPKGNNYENRSKKPAIDTNTCWFCLSNKNIEKHLIITIGNHSYISLAKGVLVAEHCLITPLQHAASTPQLSDEAFEEMENFKSALANYFHDRNLDVVIFERNYHSPHLQLQVIPVPKKMQNAVEEKLYSHTCNYKVTSLPTLSNIKKLLREKSGQYYFYLEFIADKKPEGKYLVLIDKSVDNFPLQIGRHIMAEALGVEERKLWIDCVDPDYEKEMTDNMRESFKRYDFTQI